MRFSQKGVPQKFRAKIWAYLILDRLKLSKTFFRAIFLRTIKNDESRDQVAIFDLRRLFSFANQLPNFKQLIQETEVLLNMFSVNLQVLQTRY